MEEKLVLAQTVSPDVVYKEGEKIKVDIELTNVSAEAIGNITLKSSSENLGKLGKSVSSKGSANGKNIANGITVASLNPGETVTVSYEVVTGKAEEKKVPVTTTACAQEITAGTTSIVHCKPFTRYATVSASICTEDIGCVEEVFVEKESIRYADSCGDTVISVGFFIGIKYESCDGKNKIAKRHETALFVVPTEYFDPDNLSVSVQKICSSCRDFAQCITVYLKANFGG